MFLLQTFLLTYIFPYTRTHCLESSRNAFWQPIRNASNMLPQTLVKVACVHNPSSKWNIDDKLSFFLSFSLSLFLMCTHVLIFFWLSSYAIAVIDKEKKTVAFQDTPWLNMSIHVKALEVEADTVAARAKADPKASPWPCWWPVWDWARTYSFIWLVEKELGQPWRELWYKKAQTSHQSRWKGKGSFGNTCRCWKLYRGYHWSKKKRAVAHHWITKCWKCCRRCSGRRANHAVQARHKDQIQSQCKILKRQISKHVLQGTFLIWMGHVCCTIHNKWNICMGSWWHACGCARVSLSGLSRGVYANGQAMISPWERENGLKRRKAREVGDTWIFHLWYLK